MQIILKKKKEKKIKPLYLLIRNSNSYARISD